MSTGIACWSTDVCHEIFTEVGFKKVTVIFSGAADIEPNKFRKTIKKRWERKKESGRKNQQQQKLKNFSWKFQNDGQ